VIPIRPLLMEMRDLVKTLREELEPVSVGPLLVTGMLAEQLARQLAVGAAPGAVIAADAARVAGSAAVIHVMAGEPAPADDELVREADRHGVPVVLVQLWPQKHWTAPYVLTPFVVECRVGEGFPISEIARRIIEAVEQPVALARGVPVFQDSVADAVIGTTAIRAAILGALTARPGSRSREARPLLALEQVRMLADLRLLDDAPGRSQPLPLIAGIAAAIVGTGFVFREAARRGQEGLPSPLVNATVAGAGTWLVGEAVRRLDSRLA